MKHNKYDKCNKHNNYNVKNLINWFNWLNLIKFVYKSVIILCSCNLILLRDFAYADIQPKLNSAPIPTNVTAIAPEVKLSSVPVVLPHANNKEYAEISMPNLGDADGSANDLMKLKRKLVRK